MSLEGIDLYAYFGNSEKWDRLPAFGYLWEEKLNAPRWNQQRDFGLDSQTPGRWGLTLLSQVGPKAALISWKSRGASEKEDELKVWERAVRAGPVWRPGYQTHCSVTSGPSRGGLSKVLSEGLSSGDLTRPGGHWRETGMAVAESCW